jgi:predicted transcriptional regulator
MLRGAMSARDTLHRLVDELPEEDLPAAERVLQILRAAGPHIPLDEALLDDEPDEDDFDGGLTESRADLEAGRVIPHDEVKRRWGLK